MKRGKSLRIRIRIRLDRVVLICHGPGFHFNFNFNSNINIIVTSLVGKDDIADYLLRSASTAHALAKQLFGLRFSSLLET